MNKGSIVSHVVSLAISVRQTYDFDRAHAAQVHSRMAFFAPHIR